MRASKWMTLDEARLIPVGSVVVARIMVPGDPVKYVLSTEHGDGFQPGDIGELEEFLNGHPGVEVHFLLIDEAPNEAC